MKVSQEEKDYFRRLGEFQAESHRDRLEHHLASPLAARVRASLRLAARYVHRADSAKDDDPTAFYERARRLGRYVP